MAADPVEGTPADRVRRLRETLPRRRGPQPPAVEPQGRVGVSAAALTSRVERLAARARSPQTGTVPGGDVG